MLTYLDAGILIAAAKGTDIWHQKAMAVIDDPSRAFVSTQYQRLETYCPAMHNGYQDQADFHSEFLSTAEVIFDDPATVLERAQKICVDHGVRGIDAGLMAQSPKSQPCGRHEDS